MLVGLIAGRSIDGTELAFAGHSFLQMLADLVAFEPSLGTTADSERASHGDEQQNALHPLILESERSIAIADCKRVDRINLIYGIGLEFRLLCSGLPLSSARWAI
jgi:hypothetical protein